MLEVTVEDDGVGIDEEDFPKLFKKFAPLERTKLFNPNGKGLGLYICK